MASALEIIDEEIEAARHRLKDGPILVDGQAFNDVLSTLAHKMRTRVQAECPESEEDRRCPICPHGVDLRDETCSECGLNAYFPEI